MTQILNQFSLDIAKSAVDAGASMIVTGTVIERDPGHIKNFSDAIHDGLT